jgi:hypothetical protein
MELKRLNATREILNGTRLKTPSSEKFKPCQVVSARVESFQEDFLNDE